MGRLKGAGSKPPLLLNGHLDIVPPGSAPWKRPPFEPVVVVDGKVWGRGASDMKGGLAAMLAAMFAVQASEKTLAGDVIFAGTAGEESDSVGAVRFVQEGGIKGVGGIIVGEASSCRVNIAEKGALWVEIQTHGKTAHSAFPEQGRNAVAFMNGLLADILAWKLPDSPHPLLGSSTLSLSSVHGGVSFYSDASIFAPAADIPIILYGPGDASMAHQPDECIPVESLHEAVRYYAAFMEAWFEHA